MGAVLEIGPTDPLPRESWRDWLNDLRLDFKFRWVPFRAYYRLRSYRYAAFKSPELGLLRYLVPHDRTAVDVGANLGLVTHLLARRASHVHAFEPNPMPRRILTYVRDRNVTVHAAAVSDRSGEAAFQVHRSRKGWSSNGGKLTASGGAEAAGGAVLVRVPMVRLDDLDLGRVGFLKVDVEGHEAKVLVGARNLIARDRPAVMLECEHLHVGEAGIAEIFGLMAGAGYGGLMVVNGLIEDIARFDVQRHQLAVAAVGGTRPDYVRNFIFLPR